MATNQLKNVWPDVQTIQFKEIISALVEAKENRIATMIISPTGLGKTNSIKIFRKTKPKHTYVITVGDSYKLEDVVNEICMQLGIELRERYGYRVNSVKIKLGQITKRLNEIAEAGEDPIIILDEAENLKPSVLKMIKELYDAIIEVCAIVLIGTDQILDSLLNRRNKNRISIPQLYRRFKAGTRYISPFDKSRDFKPFFSMHIPNQPGIQALLIERCDNYGELHDFLEPVIRYVNKAGKPLTEDLFRMYHKILK